jgi:hypothetical protein
VQLLLQHVFGRTERGLSLEEEAVDEAGELGVANEQRTNCVSILKSVSYSKFD